MKSFHSIDKSDVDTILAVNYYLIRYDQEKNHIKTNLFRKYLTVLINKILSKRMKTGIKKTTSFIY